VHLPAGECRLAGAVLVLIGESLDRPAADLGEKLVKVGEGLPRLLPGRGADPVNHQLLEILPPFVLPYGVGEADQQQLQRGIGPLPGAVVADEFGDAFVHRASPEKSAGS